MAEEIKIKPVTEEVKVKPMPDAVKPKPAADEVKVKPMPAAAKPDPVPDAVRHDPGPEISHRPVTDPPAPKTSKGRRCFVVKSGEHISEGKVYAKGDKFYSHEDMNTKFPNKFEPRDPYGSGDHDPEMVPSDPGKVPDYVRAADQAEKSVVVAEGEARPKAESKAEKLARVGLTTDLPEPEEDGAEDGAHGEDVTDDYPDAMKADLKVFQAPDGAFSVTSEDDEDTVLTSCPTKAALKKHLKTQVKAN